jgi:hypothetical protein
MRRLKDQETSRYLGVCWDASTASWRFSIKSKGRVYTRTAFADEQEAAVCRDRLALYLHGADAKLNFARRQLKAASFESLTFELRKARTTSRYRGVARDDRLGRLKWLASIQVKKRTYTLGRFSTERAAAQAYDRAALHYFGERAKLNFPKARPIAADDKALRVHARAEHKKTTASKYRGVSRHSSGRWAAIIGHQYRTIHLGVFVVEEDAAEAYDKAARRLHGKAAKVNFPSSASN